jgi:hypothetical protein
MKGDNGVFLAISSDLSSDSLRRIVLLLVPKAIQAMLPLVPLPILVLDSKLFGAGLQSVNCEFDKC